jgi:nucleotide-binding universal stress UspA family protein
MALKTILVHVDLSRHALARIRCAAALARAHGAHLVGAAPTDIPRDLFPQGYDEPAGTLCASHFGPLVENAKRALAQFEAIAGAMHISFEGRLVCDRADDALALQARFADLVVASQDDPDESMNDLPVPVAEYVPLNGTRPVLLLPRTNPPPAERHDVLLAWDGSKAASCAAAAAIPLLCRALSVTVLTLTGADISQIDARREQAELSAWLGRHGVCPAMALRPASGPPGAALLAYAAERRCSLLVMGCYGHTRWRETCLGGASRTVLLDARIPVLLAH